MTDSRTDFIELAPGLGMGEDVPAPRWRPLAALPFLILVGVTGVGKSTTVTALQKLTPDLRLLPNRRTLTDWLIIGALQQADGMPVEPVTDRAARFGYTRRYRERYAGGMAHALSRLLVDTTQFSGRLLFDGLRGANEVIHAANLLPHARFIMLDAPDLVRVVRLLARADDFDRIRGEPVTVANRAIAELPEAAALFDAAEMQTLQQLVDEKPDILEDLRAKLKIVAEERRNYDPAATRTALQAVAPRRAWIIDTVTHSPDQAAERIRAAFNEGENQTP
jgi:hypothetical protein